MRSISRRFAAAAAATLALTALCGPAFAAPPSTPPGQENKEEATAPAPQPQGTSSSNGGTADTANRGQSERAQEKKENSNARTANTSGSSSNGINSTNAGVKPGNNTRKHTSCRTGGSMPTPSCTATTAGSVSDAATSDHSKRYGNGSTAAQIAVGRGAPAGTEIRGPGNSQPHKVCGKNGNWVDVHAVKTYVGLTACSSLQSAGTAARNELKVAERASFGSTSAADTGTSASSAAGGVAGALRSPAEAGGVAGAFAEIGGVAGGTLPFTGFPVWAAVLIAIAAIVIGLTLWRRGGPASTRDVV